MTTPESAKHPRHAHRVPDRRRGAHALRHRRLHQGHGRGDRLGKALFWDIQAGSDSKTACATCHYNGGVDARARNQMYDGHDEAFNIFESGRGGPNTTLESSDFPFHRLSNPNDAESTVLRSVDDTHGSAGVPTRIFEGVTAGEGVEAGRVIADPVFNVNGCNVDAATDRNAPTVINAVFACVSSGRPPDYRFNGVNAWGDQDPDARVLKTMSDGSVEEVRISLDKSSLAIRRSARSPRTSRWPGRMTTPRAVRSAPCPSSGASSSPRLP